jgi:RNA polymerase sigma-70 factor, ECF subfamily
VSARTPSVALPITRQQILARVAEIYGLHRDDVYRIALRYGRSDRAWAEDVVHDVFVALCRVAEQLEDLGDIHGWLYRVTTNACLGRLRREAVRSNPAVRWLLGEVAPRPSDPEASSAAVEGVRQLLERLEQLPPRERVVLCMLHLDGLRQIEIAEVLGLSKGQVSKLVARAHARIRELDPDAPRDAGGRRDDG